MCPLSACEGIQKRVVVESTKSLEVLPPSFLPGANSRVGASRSTAIDREAKSFRSGGSGEAEEAEEVEEERCSSAPLPLLLLCPSAPLLLSPSALIKTSAEN